MPGGIWPPRGPFGRGGRPSRPSAVAPSVAPWQAWAARGSSLGNEIPAIVLRHRNPACRPVQREQLRPVLSLLRADLRAGRGARPRWTAQGGHTPQSLMGRPEAGCYSRRHKCRASIACQWWGPLRAVGGRICRRERCQLVTGSSWGLRGAISWGSAHASSRLNTHSFPHPSPQENSPALTPAPAGSTGLRAGSLPPAELSQVAVKRQPRGVNTRARSQRRPGRLPESVYLSATLVSGSSSLRAPLPFPLGAWPRLNGVCRAAERPSGLPRARPRLRARSP